jgi:hypothetical protein
MPLFVVLILAAICTMGSMLAGARVKEYSN